MTEPSTATQAMLDQVLTDLMAEGADLESVVSDLSEGHWRLPTPAEGWDIATSIGHLAWTDEAALLACAAARGDKSGWDELVLAAIADMDGIVDTAAAEVGSAIPRALLSRWRESRGALVHELRVLPEGLKLPWFGPPMSAVSMATARFMETWAHGLDVYAALGRAYHPTDRIKHVAHLGYRTLRYSFANNGLTAPESEIRLELASPGREVWTFGPEDADQFVTGSAYDFCLLVTQRIHRADTDLEATGADADTWLDIAQCFAGPAGGGRAPKAEEAQ